MTNLVGMLLGQLEPTKAGTVMVIVSKSIHSGTGGQVNAVRQISGPTVLVIVGHVVFAGYGTEAVPDIAAAVANKGEVDASSREVRADLTILEDLLKRGETITIEQG